MSLFESLFPKKEKIECPRCLGKGFVDQNDIIRLKKLLYWAPGKCAYCKGKGKINPKLLEKIRVDLEYLTIDKPQSEFKNLIKGDLDSWSRANAFKDDVQEVLIYLDYLYEIENLEISEIAKKMISNADLDLTEEAETEWIKYIETYFQSKNLGRK
jgi:hypothetical protein